MKNELKVFENKELGKVRTVIIDGEPWFVGKDVANILGYSNTKDAIIKHVSCDDKQIFQRSQNMTLDLKVPNRGLTIINESGMYALIFGSKLESAKKFKHLVTSEVLPSIRKTGGYIAGQESLTDSELMAKALLVAQKQIEERNKRIEEMKPKEVFADAVADSKTTILVGDLAKILKQNGFDMGSKRLFVWMRDNGYLIKRKGSDYNMPTQKSMELGLFVIKESVYTDYYGSKVVAKTAKITGYGQQYFINQFLGDEDAEF